MSGVGVTITGMGLITPVGRGIGEVYGALLHGRSGIVKPPDDHPIANSVELAGILPPIDSGRIASGPDGKVMDRTVILAQLAAEDALADAGLTIGDTVGPDRTGDRGDRDRIGGNVDPERVGVIIGGVGGMATLEQQVLARAERGRAAVSPYLLTGILPNMPAARVAIRFGIRGYTSSVGTACASGAQAIADAVRLIRSGEADVVLCGASEAPLFPTFAETFANARALARGWDDPAEASRPFDLRRNGFVLSEGAALLVLESTTHAAARNASGYADVVDYGVNSDAHHPTAPRPDGQGAAACMRKAFKTIDPALVGYVNAHGTSTKLGDVAESVAIGLAFGDNLPAVSSTKALTGHMLGTSGVVEAAATALAINTGVVPPTYHLDDPDPACPLDHVRKEPREIRLEYALSNSFGFGGQNVSLLFGAASTPNRREINSEVRV